MPPSRNTPTAWAPAADDRSRPAGGATAVGAVGFVHAAEELAEQCADAEFAPRTT